MLKRVLIGLVRGYRLLLSPWLGSSCRFEPTCSVYSLQALEQHGAAAGSYLTLRRLVRCHPWCAGGADPVPTERSPAVHAGRRLWLCPHFPTFFAKEVFMNDIRRTILWVIFGFSMVLLWDKWQVHNGNKAMFFPTSAPAATAAAEGAAKPPVAGSAAVPTSATNAAAQLPAAGTVAAPAPRQSVEVTTDVFKLTFDSEGGSLVKAELLKYSDVEHKDRAVVLLDDSKDRVYVAQTGLIC